MTGCDLGDNDAHFGSNPNSPHSNESLVSIEQDLRALIVILDHQSALGALSPASVTVAKAIAERALDLALNLKAILPRKS